MDQLAAVRRSGDLPGEGRERRERAGEAGCVATSLTKWSSLIHTARFEDARFSGVRPSIHNRPPMP
jgi:hypothetical protein